MDFLVGFFMLGLIIFFGELVAWRRRSKLKKKQARKDLGLPEKII